MFVFQNRFWLNLHQLLSGEAYRRSVKATPALDPATLNASDRTIWISAIDPYDDIFERSMVLDGDLIRVANTLAMTDDAAPLPDSVEDALGPNISTALKAAAPIYAQDSGRRVSAQTTLGSHPQNHSCRSSSVQ